MEPTIRPVPVLERFAEDQLVTLRRLQRAMDVTTLDLVVADLAAVALWVLGLDPIARESFDRLSRIVFAPVMEGEQAENDIINAVINEPTTAGQEWIRRQRRAEFDARGAGGAS